jgi:hypothetical protein
MYSVRFVASFITAMVLTLVSVAVRADDRRPVEALLTSHQFLNDEPSSDPDRAMLKYGMISGRWQAMAGENIVLVGGFQRGLRAAVVLAGFVELVNFNNDQPVPWESYRANVGIDTLWEVPDLARKVLPPGGRLHFALGWFHESDHAANGQGYANDFLRNTAPFASFDNANFSAYEYFKLRSMWHQLWANGKITTQITLGMRVFTPSINPGSIREMRWAFQMEGRVSVRAHEKVRPFLTGYFERLAHDFHASQHGFRWDVEGDPLFYRTVGAGMDLRSSRGSIVSPEIFCSSSYGRGVDFPRFYGLDLGLRLSFTL